MSIGQLLVGADGLTLIALCVSMCIAGIMIADAILCGRR